MVLVSHGREWRNVNRITRTMTDYLVDKSTDLGQTGVGRQLREGIDVGFDRVVFMSETCMMDRAKVIVLAGKLGAEANGKVASSASFRSWITPRTKSIDSMRDVADHVSVNGARVDAMHTPITSIQIRVASR